MMKAEIEKQIHKLAEHIYETGYEDGRKENTKIADAAYSHGLNDAWKCARKIYGMDRDTRMIAFVFNEYETVFDNYSASEAIEKIKEYEKKQKCKTCKYLEFETREKVGTDVCYLCKDNDHYKQKDADDEIKIGDEVRYKMGDNFIATQICDDWVYAIDSQGLTLEARLHDFVKTGRHFPQIAEVLEQLKREDGQRK